MAGSGKTAAFVLPLLVYISMTGRITDETAAEGPKSVILAPSRELAIQVAEQCASPQPSNPLVFVVPLLFILHSLACHFLAADLLLVFS